MNLLLFFDKNVRLVTCILFELFLYVGMNFSYIEWNETDNKENDNAWRGDNDNEEIKNNSSR